MSAAATAAKTARRTKLPPRTGASGTRRPSRLGPWLFALLCAALGGLLLLAGRLGEIPTCSDLSLASASAPVHPVAPVADASPRYVTQKIRDLEVGTWVLADNPELELAEDEYGPIDPARWRKIALRMQKPDGGTLDIDFLRPLAWVEAQKAQVGYSIHLQLEELGINGPAEVLSVASCPPLADCPSDGHHVVTGKFAHSAGNVVDLHIEGLDEPIGTTANHPFWSEDRQEFVQAGVLEVGEHVLSLDGTPSAVIALRPRTATEPVFNLEVETEHVYYVSASGVLVHNAGKAYNSRAATQLAQKLGKEAEAAADIVKNTRRIDSLSGKAKHRIPDGLTEHTLTEVKNVKYQHFSTQLQDSLHYALMTDREMILKVRRSTILSKELLEVIKRGFITLEYID